MLNISFRGSTEAPAIPVAGDAALLVDPKEMGEIAAALVALAASKERRDSLVAAGRIRAEAFSWPRAVGETYAVYRELVAV
jgi:glycosyltransferase involved in cell wall biosynthesis